jgi:uncharacterized repeat protein (TIGR03803 family)
MPMSIRTLRSWGAMLILGLGISLHASPTFAATYKILHQFCAKLGSNCPDGFGLGAPLVRDAKGNLYGTATSGGKFGGGTVFRLHPTANGQWKFDVLHDFCAQADCADGFDPQAPVIVDRQGNLYGVSAARVSSEAADGVVYRLKPRAGRWAYEILYEFCTQEVCDGEFANSGLAYPGQSSGAPYDGVSPLFGVANAGGANNAGVAYSLEPKNGHWKHTDLYSFCALADCADGAFPTQPLVVQDATHLAGVAGSGGGGGSGVVFRLTSQDGVSWSESVAHAFCSQPKCADGGGFVNSLAADAAGNLFGTTSTGGQCISDFSCGTIYEITPDDTETVLFEFCKRVGRCPSDPGAGVVIGADGTLYGTTRTGGNRQEDSGVIYAFDGTQLQRLHIFCNKGCEFGGNSLSPMIIDPQGRLFGVTPEGDRGGDGGVVYELDP